MKRKYLMSIAIAIIIVGGLLFSISSSQSQPKHYIVKLYSGDSVVGTWNALDWGTVDGQTLVFTVGERHNPTRVRINGTFSVEEKN